ncbi:hypothetical protein ACVFI8_20770 [Agarivorans sp. MS3-6]
MNTSAFRKLVIGTALLSGFSYAEEQAPDHDPSDLTRATTSAYAAMSNEGDFKVSVSGSFQVNEKQEAMLTVEGTMDNQGHYSDSRIQYFHVFSVDNNIVPKVAASIDIIDNSAFTTAALGGIANFQTGSDKINLFARAGVLGGEYKSDFTKVMGESDSVTYGATGDIFLIMKPGKDGTYFMINPEYTYMGGSINTSVLKTTLLASTPLSQDKTRWGQIKIENTYGTSESNHYSLKTDDTVVWALYKAFF